MEIRELEQAIRRIVQADQPKPLLATLSGSGSLPEEFAVAAGTLANRARNHPIAKRVARAAAEDWI